MYGTLTICQALCEKTYTTSSNPHCGSMNEAWLQSPFYSWGSKDTDICTDTWNGRGRIWIQTCLTPKPTLATVKLQCSGLPDTAMQFAHCTSTQWPGLKSNWLSAASQVLPPPRARYLSWCIPSTGWASWSQAGASYLSYAQLVLSLTVVSSWSPISQTNPGSVLKRMFFQAFLGT